MLICEPPTWRFKPHYVFLFATHYGLIDAHEPHVYESPIYSYMKHTLPSYNSASAGAVRSIVTGMKLDKLHAARIFPVSAERYRGNSWNGISDAVLCNGRGEYVVDCLPDPAVGKVWSAMWLRAKEKRPHVIAAIVVGSPNRLVGCLFNSAACLVSWSREFLMDPSPGCSALGVKDTTDVNSSPREVL